MNQKKYLNLSIKEWSALSLGDRWKLIDLYGLPKAEQAKRDAAQKAEREHNMKIWSKLSYKVQIKELK